MFSSLRTPLPFLLSPTDPNHKHCGKYSLHDGVQSVGCAALPVNIITISRRQGSGPQRLSGKDTNPLPSVQDNCPFSQGKWGKLAWMTWANALSLGDKGLGVHQDLCGNTG